jgi:hypothetical protein
MSGRRDVAARWWGYVATRGWSYIVLARTWVGLRRAVVVDSIAAQRFWLTIDVHPARSALVIPATVDQVENPAVVNHRWIAVDVRRHNLYLRISRFGEGRSAARERK